MVKAYTLSSYGSFGFENSIRVIYQTSQSKSNDGYDLITFRKTNVDGTVIEEIRYKIVGSEPELQQEDAK